MGCDIHAYVQIFTVDKRWRTVEAHIFPSDEIDIFDKKSRRNEPTTEPFAWRAYGMFAFLANVRNYLFVPPISEPRGLPTDLTKEEIERYEDYHSCSWLLLSELLSFNYDQTFGGPGNGKVITFREFLGRLFFRDITIMSSMCSPYSPQGDSGVRIVFGFDN